MANKNANLQIAKNTKDDEFYTTYETIESEVKHYISHFPVRLYYVIAMILLNLIFVNTF